MGIIQKLFGLDSNKDDSPAKGTQYGVRCPRCGAGPLPRFPCGNCGFDREPLKKGK
jgi:hypothetical protein